MLSKRKSQDNHTKAAARTHVQRLVGNTTPPIDRLISELVSIAVTDDVKTAPVTAVPTTSAKLESGLFAPLHATAKPKANEVIERRASMSGLTLQYLARFLLAE